MLKRKVDVFLKKWKENHNKKPLIISGARQIGKTTSIRELGKTYESFIEIDFVKMPQFKTIFKNGCEVKNIIKEISLLEPKFKFIEKNTLILFDEIQAYPDAATSLKSFSEDGRFDVICSGSLLGVNYKKISSIPVGFKEEYTMYSLDFEEFLWANGYDENQIEDIYDYMKKLMPLPEVYVNKLSQLFRDYIFVGGMPEAVKLFVSSGTFSESFDVQKRIYKDYEDDITKYVEGLDFAKVKRVYRHISAQLAKDNHKFQISKIGHGARLRDYIGAEEWLKDAGIVNISYNLDELNIPFSSYEMSDYFRIYYAEHSLFIANLDEESKEDLVVNENYEIYNGALYESLVSEALVKSGFKLYFYKNSDSTIELDFLIRIKNEIIPVEVKRNRGRSKSLNIILDTNENINYGLKLTNGNIGFENNKFTFPYYLTFLIKRFFKETEYIKWN
jgi:predicted AAA+ superfamily ATPase